MRSWGKDVLGICTWVPEAIESPFSLASFSSWQYLIQNKTSLCKTTSFGTSSWAGYPNENLFSWRHFMNPFPFELKNCFLNCLKGIASSKEETSWGSVSRGDSYVPAMPMMVIFWKCSPAFSFHPFVDLTAFSSRYHIFKFISRCLFYLLEGSEISIRPYSFKCSVFRLGQFPRCSPNAQPSSHTSGQTRGACGQNLEFLNSVFLKVIL